MEKIHENVHVLVLPVNVINMKAQKHTCRPFTIIM